jgi:hypothetical protein
MDGIFDQGKIWFQNKTKKIERLFNAKEGFNSLAVGKNILGTGTGTGSSVIDTLNTTDKDRLDLSLNALTQNISDYSTAYNSLKTKRSEYLGDSANYAKGRNYNVIVNRLATLDDINKIQSATGCYKKAITNSNSTFTSPINNTYGSELDATNACKIYASDSAKAYFAIGKNGNTYSCYTSSTAPSDNERYYITKVHKELYSSNNATKGGLFSNGRVGVYNENVSITNPQNIVASVAPANYNKCDVWNGGNINTSTLIANYGKNCNSATYTPIKVKKIVFSSTRSDAILQMARIAVFAYVNGKGVNIAQAGWSGYVTDVVTVGGNLQGNAFRLQPIMNPVAPRRYPYIYHSGGNNEIKSWTLTFNQEYDVYKIVYYNRLDCCNDRSSGQTLTVYNGATPAPAVVKTVTLNSDMVQTFYMT